MSRGVDCRINTHFRDLMCLL